MAEAVVALVAEGIKPLGDLIIQQAKFLSGVSYQVGLAQVELHLIRGFLKDADVRQRDEEVVRIWVKLIRDAAYDLEDAIGFFALKVAIRRRGSTVRIALKRFACILNEGVDRYKIGSEIEEIMTRLSQLRSSLQRYNITEVIGGESVASAFKRRRDRRLTYGHEVESHVVGLEENTDKLVKELVREGKHHLVVSIWGMGGSGKTTLAKQIFIQDEIKRHFDGSAWVCISQQYEGSDVLEDILIQLTSPTTEKRKEISKMKKNELAKEVCRIQREKRCLVVIDDIWTREAWSSIKAGFPINEETESRVLLTTRKKEVAMLASGNDHLHQPRQLDDNLSWELFQKIAIPTGRDETDSSIYAKKRKLGKEMLVHCSGLPLAISVLAGLLSRRHKVEEWEQVHRNVDKYIMKGTNIVEGENTGQGYGVSGVLALSYDDLPSPLKLCFLYLAQYPEDHEIPVKRLTQLWIAEGFVTPTSEMHVSMEIVEDVSYGFLTELVERSMVQVAEYGLSGKVKTCRLHDLMRDLCLQKAKEENFLDIVNFSKDLAFETRLIGKGRRLTLYLDRNAKFEFSSGDVRDGHIRSLIYFTPTHFMEMCNKKVIRAVFRDFKLLRVLKFENIYKDFDIPKTIGNLVHLRFLSLKDSAFRALPSSISRLVLLQTLDLRGFVLYDRSCFGFTWERDTKIRNVFGNMEQLRHLYLPRKHYVSRQKLSFARGCNLQTLANVRIKTCDLNDLEHLRSLSLFNVGLEDIVLSCPQLHKLQVQGKMTELPKELLGYPNLTKVALKETRLKGDQIELLGKLPNLRKLYLAECAFESETLFFSQGGFPRLEVLTLEGLDDLKKWKVEKEAMPSLRRLRIDWCQNLRAVPDGLEDITTLQELTINGMRRRFCTRIEEGGEDFHKIKHVPSLIITNIRPDEKDNETEMEEAEGASRVVASPAADDSHQESTLDVPRPNETTEEIQASSS